MNEYALYNALCMVEEVARQYEEGQKSCPSIRMQADMIASRLYRVAVIGEFKRGKSSLVNALIGTSILPTDILPLTAAITRLTYGVDRKIVVRFKDGASEERTVDELLQYATKFDERKAQMAASVQEVVVQYPSVLCKNHIEIIDTPGLNDNESMSEVTLSVLGDIDAAIVVINATLPISMTEQRLVCDLIRREGIRHIVFVASFLDQISGGERGKERVLGFLKTRIRGEVLDCVKREVSGDSELLAKAKNILEKPILFGVSSSLAMQGFISDDEELLEESRIPRFKEELLAFLTAAQSEDVPKRVRSVVSMVDSSLPKWKELEEESVKGRMRELHSQREKLKAYSETAKELLLSQLHEVDDRMQQNGLSPTLGFQEAHSWNFKLRKCFVRALVSLNGRQFGKQDLHEVLNAGKVEADKVVSELTAIMDVAAEAVLREVSNRFMERREGVGLEKGTLERRLAAFAETPLPSAIWVMDPVLSADSITNLNVMPYLEKCVDSLLTAYGEKWNRRIATWRLILIQQNLEDLRKIAEIQDVQGELADLNQKLAEIDYNYQRHVKRVQGILGKL